MATSARGDSSRGCDSVHGVHHDVYVMVGKKERYALGECYIAVKPLS